MRPNLKVTEMAKSSKSCLSVSAFVLLGLMTLNGCKNVGTIDSLLPPPPCTCVDPNGEDHLCFDFVVDAPIVEPAMIRELQDFTTSWSWRYAWEACHAESPGNSGPSSFKEIWMLTDDTGATLESCDSDSGCDSFSNFDMGNSHSASVTFAGVEVPDGKSFTTLYFTIMLVDVPAEAECANTNGETSDTGGSGFSELQPNIQTVQFIVHACPCDQGTRKLDVGVGSLAYDSSSGNTLFSWQDCYNATLCGQELDQLVGSTSDIYDRVRLYNSNGLFGTWEQTNSSVDVGTCAARTQDLGPIPPDSYEVTVEILSYTAAECHADPANNSAALSFTIP